MTICGVECPGVFDFTRNNDEIFKYVAALKMKLGNWSVDNRGNVSIDINGNNVICCTLTCLQDIEKWYKFVKNFPKDENRTPVLVTAGNGVKIGDKDGLVLEVDGKVGDEKALKKLIKWKFLQVQGGVVLDYDGKIGGRDVLGSGWQRGGWFKSAVNMLFGWDKIKVINDEMISIDVDNRKNIVIGDGHSINVLKSNFSRVLGSDLLG